MDAKDKEIAELKHRLAETERKRLTILPFICSDCKCKNRNSKFPIKL